MPKSLAYNFPCALSCFSLIYCLCNIVSRSITSTNLNYLEIIFFPVRSFLEYCSAFWNPHQSTLTIKLKRIQNRLLRVLACKPSKIGTYIENLAF
jgi:hypothetical protein